MYRLPAGYCWFTVFDETSQKVPLITGDQPPISRRMILCYCAGMDISGIFCRHPDRIVLTTGDMYPHAMATEEHGQGPAMIVFPNSDEHVTDDLVLSSHKA